MERVTAYSILILFLVAATAKAESPQDLFKQGNAAYAGGQLSQAVTLYESARSQGFEHWALYYNLGNAHYKAGETGKAIANYLRAFRINSHQKDVTHNLNLALTKTGDPLMPNEALARLFWRLFYSLSLNALALLSSTLFIAVCLGGVFYFWGRWRPPVERVVCALLVFTVVGAWFGLRVSIAERREAVIVSGIAEVRSGPNLSYAANFTIPEGRRVLVLDELEPIKGWVEIGVPKEGLKGWVPDSSVELV